MRSTRVLAMQWLVPLAVVSLLAGACGGDGPAATSPATTNVAETTTTTTTVPETTTTSTTTTSTMTTTSSTTTTTSSTTATSSTTTATLPGDPLDPIYTPAGAELAAVAVPYTATFDLRELPGAGAVVVASLPPLATGIISTGRARILGVRDVWLEVTAGGTTGWVPLFDVLYLDGTEDLTAQVDAWLGGTPTAPSMNELGVLVADVFAADGPEVVSRVVVVTEPTTDPTGEVTVDVVDLPGDSVGGYRLVVTGRQLPTEQPQSDDDGDIGGETTYELVRVGVTFLCLRGVDDTGLCV